MAQGVSFQALAGTGGGYWEVAVVWAHVLRDRIVGLKFPSQAKAEFGSCTIRPMARASVYYCPDGESRFGDPS